MDVSYNRLLKILIDKGMNKTSFSRQAGISSNTLAKISHNDFISMESLVKICRYLDCSFDEIMEIVPESKK